MLYVFLVNTGKMMTYDMNLAFETVEKLKLEIKEQHRIPPQDQVLLISGGEALEPNARVCKYTSAGTDTSPIFLFWKNQDEKMLLELLEQEDNEDEETSTRNDHHHHHHHHHRKQQQHQQSTSPQQKTKHDHRDEYMEKRARACLTMDPSLNAAMARAGMAVDLYESDNEDFRRCERRVHDQHLQQQGWAAVVANLQDIVQSFRNKFRLFESVYRNLLAEKPRYYELISSFEKDKELLGRIPLLKAFHSVDHRGNKLRSPQSKSQEDENGDESHIDDGAKDDDEESFRRKQAIDENKEEKSEKEKEVEAAATTSDDEDENITLLEWINRGKADALDEVYQLDELNHFNDENLEALRGDIEATLKKCDDSSSNIVIRGLEERFFALDQLMLEARQFIEKQDILKKSFTQTQTRLADRCDPSILPDICSNMGEQLERMIANHQSIVDIKNRCKKSKSELSHNLVVRLGWVVQVEEELMRNDQFLQLYGHRLQRLLDNMAIAENVHRAPRLYLDAVAEVVRRRRFSASFHRWSRRVSTRTTRLIDAEIERRHAISCALDRHFLSHFFVGMHDYPQNFIYDIEKIDQNLPPIGEADLDYLKRRLPDMAAQLQVPSGGDGGGDETFMTFSSSSSSSSSCKNEKRKTKLDEQQQDDEDDEDKEIAIIVASTRDDDDDTEYAEANDSLNAIDDHREETIIPSDNDDDNNDAHNRQPELPQDFLQRLAPTRLPPQQDASIGTSLTANDIVELELANSQMRSSIRDKNDTIERLEARLAMIESQLTRKCESIAACQALNTRIRSLFTTLKGEIIPQIAAQLSAQTEQYSGNVSAIRAQLDEITKKVETERANLREELQKKASMIAKFEERIVSLETELSQRENDHAQFRAKRDEDDATKREQMTRIEQLKATIDELRDQQTKKYSTITELQRALADLRAEFDASKQEFSEKFQQFSQNDIGKIEQRFRAQIDTIDAAHREAIETLTARCAAEKEQEIARVRDQLTSEHRSELDSLRHRFKLAITTTSIERTESETSLEKVQLDIVDQSAQEREIQRILATMSEQRAEHEQAIARLRAEHESNIEAIKRECEDKLEEFRTATVKTKISASTNTENLLAVAPDNLGALAQSSTSTTSSSSSSSSSSTNAVSDQSSATLQQRLKLYESIFAQFRSKLATAAADGTRDDMIQALNAQLNEATRNLDATSTSTTTSIVNTRSFISLPTSPESPKTLPTATSNKEPLDMITSRYSKLRNVEVIVPNNDDKISVTKCEFDDNVLVYFDVKVRHYVVWLLNAQPAHYVHTDSLKELDIKQEPTEFQCFIAKVLEKEYCQIKKEENRYKLPVNTKFYRVKVKPISKIHSGSSASTTTTSSQYGGGGGGGGSGGGGSLQQQGIGSTRGQVSSSSTTMSSSSHLMNRSYLQQQQQQHQQQSTTNRTIFSNIFSTLFGSATTLDSAPQSSSSSSSDATVLTRSYTFD